MTQRWIFAVLVVAMANISVGRCQQQPDSSPSVSNCGVSKSSVSDGKIVGGRNAIEGEFPWQMRPLPLVSEFQHICGASVLNNNWAVTAAHCIAGGYFSRYRVLAGAQNVTKKRAFRPTYHSVVPVVHEGYNPLTSLRNDIALLRLEQPFELEASEGYINGVCLPAADLADNVTGTGTVSGWGTTSQGGSLSETLLAVDIPILSDEQCKEAYQDSYENTMLCAGYKEGGKDSCQGDSGGPFVQRSVDGVSTLLGIVSWGRGCADPNYPGVYTEVAHYLDWIARTIKVVGALP